MSTKFRTWWENVTPTEGTVHEIETKTHQECEEDTNIHTLIEKYGIKALEMRTKPEEELYIDTTLYDGTDLNAIIEQKRQIKEYYENLPSKVRKSYADDFDMFYEKLKKGELDDFVDQGILSEEHKKSLDEYIQQKEKNYVNKLVEEYKIEEMAKKKAQEEVNGKNA